MTALSDAVTELKDSLDALATRLETNPDVDAAVIELRGLSERVATLDPDAPPAEGTPEAPAGGGDTGPTA